MPRTRRQSFDETSDAERFLSLVESGKLFEVQDWLSAARPIEIPEAQFRQYCPLYRAVDSGFHSMVEVLLRGVKGWPQHSLDEAASRAASIGRSDLLNLLKASGASGASLRFDEICHGLDLVRMEEALRAGADPAKENAFARALDEMKARPLLRFYRSHRKEFPALHAQASLALAEAVSERKVRWTALLAWAGADPFMKVPSGIDRDWTFEEYDNRTAARDACWSSNGELFKALNLKPTPEQAMELLESIGHFPNIEIATFLLRHVPKDQLNAGERSSCPAVEGLVHRYWYDFFGAREHERDKAALCCLELLLDAGAKWHPEPKEIANARRSLIKHPSEYVVSVVRLLLYVPGASELATVRDLCRTPAIQKKIAERDKPLLKELSELCRK